MNNEKEYVVFLTELIKRMENHYAGKVTGEVCTSVKNNNVPAIGLLLKKDGEQIAPNFYLEKQFVDWMCGINTLDEVFEQLRKTYEEELKNNSWLPSQISFTWEEFRHNVYMRLINTEWNKDMLPNIPHQEFLDLSIVYYYFLSVAHGMNGTILITNEHMKLLGISLEELQAEAKKNEELFCPPNLYSMWGEREYPQKIEDGKFESVVDKSGLMYIMTNKKGMFGASIMTAQKELQRFAEHISGSFYILPSSVHEIILVPETDDFSAEYFAPMVHDINKTHVNPIEVLSDSIYFYDMEAESVRKLM